jgi:hypothetical protein
MILFLRPEPAGIAGFALELESDSKRSLLQFLGQRKFQYHFSLLVEVVRGLCNTCAKRKWLKTKKLEKSKDGAFRHFC